MKNLLPLENMFFHAMHVFGNPSGVIFTFSCLLETTTCVSIRVLSVGADVLRNDRFDVMFDLSNPSHVRVLRVIVKCCARIKPLMSQKLFFLRLVASTNPLFLVVSCGTGREDSVFASFSILQKLCFRLDVGAILWLLAALP